MRSLGLDRLLDFLRGPQLVWALLWLGLILVTCSLLALMATRWGQSRPLQKCIVLSLLTHLLLATYATTVQIMASAPGASRDPLVHITTVEGPGDDALDLDGAQEGSEPAPPWEQFAIGPLAAPDTIDPGRRRTEPSPEPQRSSALPAQALPGELPLEPLPASDRARPAPQPLAAADPASNPPEIPAAEPIEAPPAARRDVASAVPVAAAGPDRAPAAAADGDLEPRPGSTEILAALPAPPAPLPEMTGLPVRPDPASALAGLTDRPSPTSRGPLGPEPHIPAPVLDRSPADQAGGTPDESPQRSGSTDPIAGHDTAGTPGNPAPDDAGGNSAHDGVPRLGPGRGDETERHLPRIYELRLTPHRLQVAERHGGSAATEAAVRASLKWLAAHQEADGRWDASRFGAGRELRTDGRNRGGAGANADTGVTGLALLAFLAAGHTHVQGEYRQVVGRGLDYLVANQAADGSLGGIAETYAFMYCHGMATLATSETYAMTGDRRLFEPVERAVAYTVAAQHPTSGGWRYRPGDLGDTSQLGWQLMALTSAEAAGIEIPAGTRAGAIRFLKSVSSGRHGGLASYRPGERVTRPMTAEALASRQFLGMARRNPASDEAGDYLLGELPGERQANLYYWYYATLGMYQLQGVHWRRWNEALAQTLVASQRTEGDLAGSWDPDGVWGGHGGRVYSTALGALCLEVYYRFLPLYVETAVQQRPAE